MAPSDASHHRRHPPNTLIGHQNRNPGRQRKADPPSPTGSCPLSPGAGRRGPRSTFSPAMSTPTARVRQGAHSPTQRMQLLGGIPESQRGPLRAEGERMPEKTAAATGMPGREPPPPPPHTRPLVPGPAPPRGRVLRSPAPSGLHWPARLPLHVHPGCHLGCPSGARLLQGVGLGSYSTHHPDANQRPSPEQDPTPSSEASGRAAAGRGVWLRLPTTCRWAGSRHLA